MPQNTSYAVGSSWVMLTDANVTSLTFQNRGNFQVEITATNGTTPPATSVTGVTYAPGQGERNVALTDLAPGVSGANRVWARVSEGAAGSVFVSHA